jgi:hypothetical protein
MNLEMVDLLGGAAICGAASRTTKTPVSHREDGS